MKSLKGQVYVAIICIILGLMLAYQFRNIKHLTILSNQNQIDDLENQLTADQKVKEDLEKKITDLETQITQYEKNASNSDAWVKSLTDQLNNLRDFAGLTKLQGPGVILTVSATQDPSLGTNAAKMPVDYRDLLTIVNELNASGAEAIMVNGQRIVNTTPIRNIGDASIISINGVRSSAFDPVKIYAIGDPNSLETALNMNGGIKDTLVGLTIKIQKSNNVTVNPYQRSTDMKYAKSIKDGE